MMNAVKSAGIHRPQSDSDSDIDMTYTDSDGNFQTVGVGLVNTAPGLLPSGTKPLPEPMLNSWDTEAFSRTSPQSMLNDSKESNGCSAAQTYGTSDGSSKKQEVSDDESEQSASEWAPSSESAESESGDRTSENVINRNAALKSHAPVKIDVNGELDVDGISSDDEDCCEDEGKDGLDNGHKCGGEDGLDGRQRGSLAGDDDLSKTPEIFVSKDVKPGDGDTGSDFDSVSTASNGSSSESPPASPETTTEKKDYTHTKRLATNTGVGDYFEKRNGRFICKICGIEYVLRQKLKPHINVHTEKYKCTICDRVFVRKTSYDSHLLKHINGSCSVFSCEICGKGFKQKSNKNTHMKLVHSNERIFFAIYVVIDANDVVIFVHIYSGFMRELNRR